MRSQIEPIFVVEDDTDTAALITRWLESSGHQVEHLVDAEECLAALGRYVPGLICLDIDLPGMSGIELLEQVRARHPRLPVLMLTAHTEVDAVVRAMQLGAYDYLVKPVDKTRLLTSVGNALERARMGRQLLDLSRRAEGLCEYEGIVGRSPSMQRLFAELDRVSSSDITVLLHGESGTGKELVARAIHARSGRSRGPFVALNCAAVPESLMEAEFFGHEKGAFTGAQNRRPGRFEQAHRGTLFLDEIAELALPLQAKLLRALQERKVQRVGGTEEVPVDFRLVAATHRSLLTRVREGAFREDLFYRLAVFEIELPPLRSRTGDLPLLVGQLLRKLDAQRSVTVSDAAMALLSAHEFPGNVRELENALHRALVVCRGDVIEPEDLPARLREVTASPVGGGSPRASTQAPEAASPASPDVPPARLDEIEREALRSALARAGGNVSQVVRELGIGRTTVYRKIKEYGLR